MTAAPDVSAGSAQKVQVSGASGTPGEGPYVVLHLTLGSGVIESGSFECNGCPAAQLAACGVLTFVKGRTVQQALLLDANDLSLLVGGFAPGKGFYADKAIEALRHCLNDRPVL